MPWSCGFLFIPLIYALPILITNSVYEGTDSTLPAPRLLRLKRQVDWTSDAYSFWYPLYAYPSSWPFDPYAWNTYARPDFAPPAVNLQPQPPQIPSPAYDPCKDPNSVNWKVNCNGGDFQKTTIHDGGAGSVQVTGSFHTYQYGGLNKPFVQPFKALGPPNINSKFPESQSQNNPNCIGGFDLNGLPCSNSGSLPGVLPGGSGSGFSTGSVDGDGSGSTTPGTSCVNGIDSNGDPCGSGSSNDDDGGGGSGKDDDEGGGSGKDDDGGGGSGEDDAGGEVRVTPTLSL